MRRNLPEKIGATETHYFPSATKSNIFIMRNMVISFMAYKKYSIY